MSQFIKFYFTSSMLDMFRTLIHPSSGACDFLIVSPHWSCVLVSMCVGVSVWLGWSGIHVAGWSSDSACHVDTTATTLVMCSCFDVCWSFGVAGLGWYPCGRLKQCFSLLHGYHRNHIGRVFLFRCVFEFRCGWVGVVSTWQAEAVIQPAM